MHFLLLLQGQFYLANMYARGAGSTVEQSFATARDWYTQAAAQGLVRATEYLHVLNALEKESNNQADPDSTFELAQYHQACHPLLDVRQVEGK